MNGEMSEKPNGTTVNDGKVNLGFAGETDTDGITVVDNNDPAKFPGDITYDVKKNDNIDPAIFLDDGTHDVIKTFIILQRICKKTCYITF